MSNYDFELDLDSINTMSIINSWIQDRTEILEFGPANGRLTRHLSLQRKCNVTIVEIDESSGKEAAQYAVRAYIGAEEGNINNLCWYDESRQYDYIIFADVLEHLENPKKILEKCMALLTPMGAILVSIPNMAHNSILIDLYNDNFNYSDTGLLDKTHIHFFTYRSFFNMISEIKLVVTDQQQVYSRVGWNEISSYYEDVPYAVEREFRNRKSGAVYQYVFCLQKEALGKRTLSYEEIKPLIDLHEEEASCFFWIEGSNPNGFKRLGKPYFNSGNKHLFHFDISANVEKVRFDPLETNGVFIISDVKIKLANQAPQKVNIMKHNASNAWNNLYYFKNCDPQLEIDIPDYNGNPVAYVELCLKILDSHLDEQYIQIYDAIFEAFEKNITNRQDYQEVLTNWLAQSQNSEYQKQLVASKAYEEHLLRDIECLKSEIVTSKRISDEYIAHLEKDIVSLKTENNTQKASLAEQAEYIQHLTADIECIKNDLIVSKTAYEEYIAHLEQDIKVLKEKRK